jgi:hypothetical protein
MPAPQWFLAFLRPLQLTSGRLPHVAPHLGIVGRDGPSAATGRGEEPWHKDTRMVEHHYGHLATSFSEAIRAGAPVYGIEANKKIVPP